MEVWIAEAQKLLHKDSPWAWLATAIMALTIAFLIKFILRLVSSKLRRLAQRTISIWDDVTVDILDGLKAYVLFIWILFFLGKSLQPTEFQRHALLILMVAMSCFQFGLWGLYLIKSWRKSILDPRITKDPSATAALGLLYTAVQTIFITVLVLAALSNLGVNISALVAGLGVGGIAVALAAQNVLGDLLASLSIVLDKPFVVGDFIVAGTELGTVEHIGIKTTRLRSLSGEQLVLSNKDLLESRIRNFKRMWQRRVVQRFGVIYSTPAEKLEQIPGWVKEIVLKRETLLFDRCHFMSYGNSSLDFELVFFVKDPNYNVYMDQQQMVLLDIFRKFSAENVEFAFPTQSLYIEKLPALADFAKNQT